MYRYFVRTDDGALISVYRLKIDDVNKEFIEEVWFQGAWVDSSPKIFNHLIDGDVDLDEIRVEDLQQIAPQVLDKTKENLFCSHVHIFSTLSSSPRQNKLK